MGHDDALEVIRQAERIVWAAGWHLQEQSVLEQMAGTRGLACARLEPRSDAIQLVAYDGEHLGHVRRDGTYGTSPARHSNSERLVSRAGRDLEEG